MLWWAAYMYCIFTWFSRKAVVDSFCLKEGTFAVLFIFTGHGLMICFDVSIIHIAYDMDRCLKWPWYICLKCGCRTFALYNIDHYLKWPWYANFYASLCILTLRCMSSFDQGWGRRGILRLWWWWLWFPHFVIGHRLECIHLLRLMILW